MFFAQLGDCKAAKQAGLPSEGDLSCCTLHVPPLMMARYEGHIDKKHFVWLDQAITVPVCKYQLR